MMTWPILLAAAAVGAALASAASLAAGGGAPPLLEAARERAGVSSLRGSGNQEAVWVSVGSEDAAAAPWLGKALLDNGRAAVFRVSPGRLAPLSRLMHQRRRACGGFFTHASLAEAEADLAAVPATAGGPYTVDQQALLQPLVARVREGEIRSTIAALAAFPSRYYESDGGVAAAYWLAGRWRGLAASLPGASVRLVEHRGWRQPSVVLTVPGSELPGETVVLGAHLDSISGLGAPDLPAPGADDDASGVAVLTEALRVLGEGRFKPRRTLEFMAYAAEEVGLRGSRQIAQEYRGSGRTVTGAVQFDMTNFAGSGDAVYVLSDGTDFALTTFLRRLVDAYAGAPWVWTRCGYACSDHASWKRSGYPAAAAVEADFQAANPAMHTAGDTLAASGGAAAHSVKFARLAVAFAVEAAKPD